MSLWCLFLFKTPQPPIFSQRCEKHSSEKTYSFNNYVEKIFICRKNEIRFTPPILHKLSPSCIKDLNINSNFKIAREKSQEKHTET